MIRIPFNRPTMVGNELEYVAEAIRNGRSAGDADFTKKCHHLLEKLLGGPRVFLTTSCTDALELAALLLHVLPGDEVILPSYTFVSTANAFVLRGAKPVFIDIRPDTLNMDEKLLPRLISRRTRAVVPVHYAGVGCEMDKICELAANHGISVVEDNAHGLFGKYRGRFLGTFGSLATQSFHETKNFTCGEGGALLVNDLALLARTEILRQKGTNRSRFFRGEVDKYTWVDVGSSFLPSDILAAFLFAQLEARDRIQKKRRKLWESYNAGLKEWAEEQAVRLPYIPPHCQQSYHMFYLIMPSASDREALIEHLRNREILSVFHYLPLHLSEMGRKFGGKRGDCPVTEDLSERLVRLPFYNDLTQGDQERVIDAVREFRLAAAVSGAVRSTVLSNRLTR